MILYKTILQVQNGYVVEVDHCWEASRTACNPCQRYVFNEIGELAKWLVKHERDKANANPAH